MALDLLSVPQSESKALMWFAPAGFIFYLLSIPYTRRLHDDIARIDTTTAALQGIIAEIVRQ